MPSHLKQAQHNERLAKKLAQEPMEYKDWVITALFYATIHYVEAFWARDGWHSNDHTERDDYIKRRFYGKTAGIRLHYKSLKESCWNVRYLCKDTTRTDCAVDYYSEKDIIGFFNKLKEIEKGLSKQRPSAM